MTIERRDTSKLGAENSTGLEGENISEIPASEIPQTTMAGQIAERLREMILTKELKPGQRVTERLLTEELGISRTPLREAFKTLAAEGLLVLQPNRGVIVAKYNNDVLCASLEFIEILESMAGMLAAERASDDEINEIEAVHCEMKAAFLRRDRIAYYGLNRDIHNKIIVAARNEVLAHEYQMVNSRLFRVRYEPNYQDECWVTAMQEHENILEALKARDGPQLSRFLREHLKRVWARRGITLWPQEES